MADRTLVVTGASRGIGAAIALAAAAKGWRVVINCRRSQDAAEALARSIIAAGGAADVVMADIADPRGVEHLFGWVDAHYGRLDGLVNNAGITGPRARIDAQRAQDLQEVITINAIAAAWCVQAAAKRMARSRGGNGGSIVNISSQAAVFGGTNVAGYAMSKAALNTMTIAAARELAGEDIRVNAVSPGVIETEMLGDIAPAQIEALRRSLPMGRPGRAEEVAEAVVWLLSDAPAYVSGAILPVAGAR